MAHLPQWLPTHRGRWQCTPQRQAEMNELVYNFSVNFSMSWIVQMMFFATQFVDRSSWHTCGINNCPKLSFPGRHGVSELLLDITVHQLLFFSWIAHQTHWDVTGLFDNLGFDGKMENCKFPKYVFSIKYLTFSHQILGNTVMSHILCLDLVASTAQHVETTCPKKQIKVKRSIKRINLLASWRIQNFKGLFFDHVLHHITYN